MMGPSSPGQGRLDRMAGGMRYVIQYLRPDGWWDAGAYTWSDRHSAERDAVEQLPKNVKWRVVKFGGKKHAESVVED